MGNYFSHFSHFSSHKSLFLVKFMVDGRKNPAIPAKLTMRNNSEEYPEKDDLGKKGEELARFYLIGKGYHLLDLNWHYGHKEIDIIARQGNEIVVVEVKTRMENYAEEPWEAISTGKIRNLVEAADAWLILRDVEMETRFDVISIVMKKDGNHSLEHFERAFSPPVN